LNAAVAATALAAGLAGLTPWPHGARAAAQAVAPTLRTRWARDVTPSRVLPEYPRPQMARSRWRSLNGPWSYAITTREAPPPASWDGTILVPFPIESQLSGVRRAVVERQRLWYRRTFRSPRLPSRGRLLLHFGAVDWEAVVFVNGRTVGEHRGGYDPFTFDITDALRRRGEEELVVGVWDPTDHGPQPRGKQVQSPEGIWYTAVTGIWQTVWLEPVPRVYINHLEITPDLDAGTVHVKASVSEGRGAGRVRVAVLDGTTPAGEASGAADSDVVVRIAAAHAWSPSDPFLYGLRVRLGSGDAVEGYVGMRKIAVGRDDAGVNRLLLNGRPLFELGTLDQGWWPDGLYTAPTDEALRSDLETLRRLGFNLVRKHVKVEPERWYYWCDRLGLLVWQDMPSGNNDTAEGKAGFSAELERVVGALRNHPSIVMWVPFNEGWGQHDTERYAAWLKARDPSRLVDDASGWTDRGAGDVMDIHDYPGPAAPPPELHRAAVLGEFGGLGLPVPGHLWIERGNWGYRRFATTDALWTAYQALLAQLRFLIGDGLAAAVYTQTTDVETEVNGLMTYDRAVIKLPAAAAEAHARLYGPPPVTRTVVPDSRAVAQRWRYTTTPPDSGWSQPGFGDSAWAEGDGGFGTDSTPGARVRTTWNTPDIWLRRSFELPAAALTRPALRIHHDEDAEVYLNGHLVATLPGYTTGYVVAPLDDRARAALQAGRNTLAVHVHQTTGGQYIDLGLIEVIE
jgi:beta-galactosidase/beta-glucuronidase